jgi:magnesium chelatase family protein
VEARLIETAARPAGGSAATLLADAVASLRLSARGFHRVLRVARTLADLDGKSGVERIHIAEALAYRSRWDRPSA